MLGALNGEGGAYRRSCEEQRRAVREELSKNPAFSRVEVSNDCDGGLISLSGRVRTQGDRSQLRRSVTHVIGDSRSNYAVTFIQVDSDEK
jgi:hypothetical protein